MWVLAFTAAALLIFVLWRLYVTYKSIYTESCATKKGDLGKEYDFVIVGGGTAGCILASRLSEHRGTTVLLIEAGKVDDGPFFRLNLLGATFMSTPHHWNLFTEPEPELLQTDSKTRGRVLIQCRAKCLGGCSSLNLAIWHRGRPADYDMWSEKLGCKGWGWDELKPYFEKCEGKGDLANRSGFFDVHRQRFVSLIGEQFCRACASILNIPLVGTFLKTPSPGVGQPHNMVFADGTRCNAVRAYLTRRGNDGVRVCDRPNLTIATETYVTKIALDTENVARGVKYIRGAHHGFAMAKHEVLLCAGTIHSPSLLIHSGVGPAESTAPCKVELPGVGRNLKDVASSGVVYSLLKTQSIDKMVKTPLSLAKFTLGVSSPLHSNTMDAFAFTSLDSKVRQERQPELMLSVQSTRFPFACVGSYIKTVEAGQTGELPNAFTVHTTLLQPRAEGKVEVFVPRRKPKISHNYLSHPEDMKAMIAAIKLARRVAASEKLDGIRGKELLPGPEVKSDKDIEDYLRRSSCHFFGTLVGTCKMGDEKDPKAVVDSRLRVRGTKRLRVVDASVIPIPVSGFTQATVAAISERAADQIKEAYRLK